MNAYSCLELRFELPELILLLMPVRPVPICFTKLPTLETALAYEVLSGVDPETFDRLSEGAPRTWFYPPNVYMTWLPPYADDDDFVFPMRIPRLVVLLIMFFT